ncbi:hypothetical protein [Algihabitans albus]|uniref:hypothetical protein n=1 Tax=Algihabitans albus TaxID=2164067 RepID=UPI000E5D5A35|nr:hypothetical protein [Algihabitans albus]
MAADTRPVPLPRLSAALYLLMTLVMLALAGVCLQGGIRSVAQAERALALRDVATELTELSIAVAKGEPKASALTRTLQDWLLQTAPRPAAAAGALAEARGLGSDGNPRLVARQVAAVFDDSDLSGALLQAHLFLVMRDERQRAVETILNALAGRYGLEIERRSLRETVSAWVAGEAAPETEALLRTLPEAETPAGIFFGAGVKLILLACLLLGGLVYARRFLGDARRLLRYGRL